MVNIDKVFHIILDNNMPQIILAPFPVASNYFALPCLLPHTILLPLPIALSYFAPPDYLVVE